jgi:putative transposase
MSRPIRIEFEDAVYHVAARGNEQRSIYRDDADRLSFLGTLSQTCERFGVVVHAYCLMPNHYHLAVQTPRANLSQVLAWLQTTYSVHFNRRHQRSGHLFQGRFKAHLVEANAYAHALVKYIHLNPVRPHDKSLPIPSDRGGELDDFPWSSHRAYAGYLDRKQLPVWLSLDWLWYFGRTRQEACHEYRREMAQCFGRGIENPFSGLRGGLVLGGDDLWTRVKDAIAKSHGRQEIQWSRHVRQAELSTLIERLLKDEPDQRLQIWLRVRLGGERMVDVAERFGYCSGSAVHQVVRRIENRRHQDPALAQKLAALEAAVESVKS